jgi:hypothetical protein
MQYVGASNKRNMMRFTVAKSFKDLSEEGEEDRVEEDCGEEESTDPRPRPRGRAPLGKVWNGFEWISGWEEERKRMLSERAKKAAKTRRENKEVKSTRDFEPAKKTISKSRSFDMSCLMGKSLLVAKNEWKPLPKRFVGVLTKRNCLKFRISEFTEDAVKAQAVLASGHVSKYLAHTFTVDQVMRSLTP